MLYDLAIAIYDILVHLAAPFSRKPRKMMKGHWVVYELLRQQLEKDVRYIWFHAASLGEFEQGRPLIEKIRAKYPDPAPPGQRLSLIHISEPTRLSEASRMPSSA